MVIRKNELKNEEIHTIYFGGGTPSICTIAEIDKVLKTIYANFKVSNNPEITLEANPDDLNLEKLKGLKQIKINRLSIGVQSFLEEDLKLMNRSHNADEALNCILEAKKYFENISIDLIYGVPNLSNQAWHSILDKTISLGIPHISCYALTVEPNTALEKQIKKGVVQQPKDSVAHIHHQILVETLEKANYVNYEFSNFGKEGFFSKNNTAYWKGEKYLGIGPAAHSFNGTQRSWNVSNNNLYIKGIEHQKPVFEIEALSKSDRYNEYVMTGLRTIWGISLEEIKHNFGEDYLCHLKKCSKKHLENKLIKQHKNHFYITAKGKFLTDGIVSDLFFLN